MACYKEARWLHLIRARAKGWARHYGDSLYLLWRCLLCQALADAEYIYPYPYPYP